MNREEYIEERASGKTIAEIAEQHDMQNSTVRAMHTEREVK